MGNEAACTLRYEGKTFSGKALLETEELLFRGQTRLRIPFLSIVALEARDGRLHVLTKEGLAVFEIGPPAEKWREKIVNPKSLVEKLGVKSGEAVSLLGKFPSDFVTSLKKHGAAVLQDKITKDVPRYFLAAESRKDLQRVKPIANSLRRAAALWIVYPKGQTSITETDVRSTGLRAGLTDIKVARFSATHTALKFVIPQAKR
jgi:hypothetical protein